ncbi:hypothetical protein JOD63_001372 [Microbacterium terrae]|uniref:hypothetical protein n=1 Tax=Microbacterium terrae TaxID=69369 RepID=UPI001B3ACC2B|nr:hypothetical protein [Microbacterium terrae]MBP1077404.1 hypothetical protein [Microbacterium terrae]
MGDHVPAVAVSVDPTDDVPLIVGVGAVVNATVGTAVPALVLLVVVYPERLPVVVTATVRPASDVVSLYVFAVAPEIDVPFRFH